MTEIEFLRMCSKALRLVGDSVNLNQSEIAKALSTNDFVVRSVCNRLASDNMAGCVGAGPLSRNHNSIAFSDFYDNRIREIERVEFDRKLVNRYYKYSIASFWCAMFALACSFASLIVQLFR